LNINVLADYNMSSQETLLMLAMVLWQRLVMVICVFHVLLFYGLDMGYWANLTMLSNTDPSY
jgi:hypothetical protein